MTGTFRRRSRVAVALFLAGSMAVFLAACVPGTAAAPTAGSPASATATDQPSLATTRPSTSLPTADPASHLPFIDPADLPPEALDTLRLIEEGGPFPFDRDGITFQNREELLPDERSGYYREFTVITPGLSHRGARRIVAGEAGERYYTADHYESFERVRPSGSIP